MESSVKLALVALIAPLAAACAGDASSGGGPDWSQATPYNVTTGKGDRVTVKVVGNGKDGYDYSARIRHTTRSDPDPLDRQRVLADAVQTVTANICATGAKEARPVHSADNYEQSGHFVCAAR